MGYHATIQTALVNKITAALSIPVLNALALTEVQAQRFSTFVAIVRDRIDMEAHVEINPSTGGNGTQLEHWEWLVYVKGGGGSSDDARKGAVVDLLLETIRTALDAQRLDSTCGPLSLVSENFEEESGTGVVYLQRWRHTRLVG